MSKGAGKQTPAGVVPELASSNTPMTDFDKADFSKGGGGQDPLASSRSNIFSVIGRVGRFISGGE